MSELDGAKTTAVGEQLNNVKISMSGNKLRPNRWEMRCREKSRRYKNMKSTTPKYFLASILTQFRS